MHPCVFAASRPNHPAVVMAGSGKAVTYAELDRRSNQVAQLLRAHGLTRGMSVAIMLKNVPEYFELAWGAQRAGLYYTCISSQLSVDEAAYIVADCGAKLFITDVGFGEVAIGILAQNPGVKGLTLNGTLPGYESYERLRDAQVGTPIADESAGTDMLYSSGTTGRPKGVKPPLPEGSPVQGHPVVDMCRNLYGMDETSIYLSPAPLYHSAPLRFAMAVHRMGGTVVVMEKFDAEEVLRLIEKYRITNAQFVPTHFIRLLKLPEDVRRKYDHSSLKTVWHAAAPCPVHVKQAMMDWWGPIVHEYYGGTEMNGLTVVNPQEWLARPGTVGRLIWGTLRICDEDGNELPPRGEGVIYVQDGRPFEYHNDPVKTASTKNRHGWTTIGDIGWVDEDGWLYLTDRKSFMIISGGVNIYPQEIENLMTQHPKIADVAVFGGPDEEMGERIIAVVQPDRWEDAGPELAAEITEWMQGKLSRLKQPRQIDFERELPRHQTGKLYKRLLRDRYWAAAKGGA
jgi:long-chain acyl-CoA synthetase